MVHIVTQSNMSAPLLSRLVFVCPYTARESSSVLGCWHGFWVCWNYACFGCAELAWVCVPSRGSEWRAACKAMSQSLCTRLDVAVAVCYSNIFKYLHVLWSVLSYLSLTEPGRHKVHTDLFNAAATFLSSRTKESRRCTNMIKQKTWSDHAVLLAQQHLHSRHSMPDVPEKYWLEFWLSSSCQFASWFLHLFARSCGRWTLFGCCDPSRNAMPCCPAKYQESCSQHRVQEGSLGSPFRWLSSCTAGRSWVKTWTVKYTFLTLWALLWLVDLGWWIQVVVYSINIYIYNYIYTVYI